jgi:surface carbohydrate biosynthesis protein
MLKILLVLNKPNREMPIMEAIKSEILFKKKDSIVKIIDYPTVFDIRFVVKFAPDVILTFPFTCAGSASPYYIYKYIFNTKIICLRAEGVLSLLSERELAWAAGFEDYGSTLVDLELFWGEGMAMAIGNLLLKQKKISSLSRVKIVGYPRLEKYFLKNADSFPLPQYIIEKYEAYPVKNRLLFITGFHLSNYTVKNLFDAKDLDAENNLDFLLDGVSIAKRYKIEWIDKIICLAKAFPDLLFIVKKHPVELIDDYCRLGNIFNILYIHEDIDVADIMKNIGLFFHYGSTSLVDSYLSNIPSIYIYSNLNKSWYADLGMPSTARYELNDLDSAIKNYLNGIINFTLTDDIKNSLFSLFNIKLGTPYVPSQSIANFIIDSSVPKKIKIYDYYLIKAITNLTFQIILSKVYRMYSILKGFFCKKLSLYLR